MACLRQKGNQLAIVHGVRDSETRKVEQKTLFTFYSKAEALAALGRSEAGRGVDFRGLVERANPGIRFRWDAILERLEETMDVLPDLWNYREDRLEKSFRESLVMFARQLLSADPQSRISSARLLAGNRAELEYLRHLIDRRLRTSDQEEHEWNRDTPFFWFHALPTDHLHPDGEEYAERLYLEGRYDEAQPLFELFIECYPRYADGYNHLGAIREERHDLEGAIALYEKAIELGRTLFSKRLAKKHYWKDLDTRPYMRGLRNLTGALNRAARYEEALELCDRQETECDDDMSAGWHTRSLESQLNDAIKAWRSHEPELSRPGYTTMTEMKSLPFAESQINRILP